MKQKSEPEFMSREDLLVAVGQASVELDRLEEGGLFLPSGRTPGNVPYYEEHKVKELEHILQLLKMGYLPDEVKKIVRKVGVPVNREGKSHGRAPYLTVGELADRAGIGVRTIKHWEEKGILPPTNRSAGGFRFYSERAVHFVQLIRDLQLFGYTLEEIKDIADCFRSFREVRNEPEAFPKEEILKRAQAMGQKITMLTDHARQLKSGLLRLERILQERKKEVGRLTERAGKKEKSAPASKRTARPEADPEAQQAS